MLELIMVRHGETDSNKKGTYCGWTDAPLNDKGLSQAFEAAGKLRSVEFAAVYCSPLARAIRTGEIILEGRNIGMRLAEPLKEHNFGIWEDMTNAEILEKYPDEAAEWEKDWVNYAMEGGESAIQSFRRISAFIDEIVSTHKNGTLLFVSHLGVIKYILVHLLGLPVDFIWRFGADNGSITSIVISEDGFAWLKKLNS